MPLGALQDSLLRGWTLAWGLQPIILWEGGIARVYRNRIFGTEYSTRLPEVDKYSSLQDRRAHGV